MGSPGLEYVYDKQGPEAARAYYDATLLGLDQIRTFVEEYGVDCELEVTGSTMLAMNEKHLELMLEEKERYDQMGIANVVSDETELRRRIHSERFVGALHDPNHAIANPAKLALGMKGIIESLGVEVSERSKVMRIEPGKVVRVVTEFAEVMADEVVIALNGYAPQIGLFKTRIMPVYGWASATEPLSQAQMQSIGWASRESLWDMRSNDLMYLRLSADNRIVFGEGGSDPLRRLAEQRKLPARHRQGAAQPARDLPAARGRALHPRLGRHHGRDEGRDALRRQARRLGQHLPRRRLQRRGRGDGPAGRAHRGGADQRRGNRSPAWPW